MGRYLRQPVHVELYGLPGSGKSTTSKILAGLLRQQGYDVKEPSAEIDSFGAFRRVLTKVFRTASFYWAHPDLWHGAKKLVQRNGYTGLSKWPQLVNIAQKFHVYCSNVTPCIYVWDEGMVQAAISLSVGGTLASPENEHWFRKFIPDELVIIKIYIETPMEIVRIRLANRNGRHSRVEKAHDETKKEELLRKFEQACKEIEPPHYLIKAGNRTSGDIANLMQERIERMLLNAPKGSLGNRD